MVDKSEGEGYKKPSRSCAGKKPILIESPNGSEAEKISEEEYF